MTFEDEEQKILVFVYMPRRSILCFHSEARYKWMHGIFSWHIQNRRIALTMREPGNDFKVCLFCKFFFQLFCLGRWSTLRKIRKEFDRTWENTHKNVNN